MPTSFAVSLLSTSLSMSILVLFLIALFSKLPKILSAKAQYLIWIVVLIGLIIPFRPTIGFGLVTLDSPSLPLVEEAIESSQEILSPAQSSGQAPTGTIAEHKNSSLPSLSIILFATWMVVGMGVFCWHMLAHRRFLKAIKRWGNPVTDESVLRLFQHTKDKLSIKNAKIRLLTCAFVSTPMLTGLIHPVILLPDKSMNEDELALVFEHELTHYKHKDLPIQLLCITASSIHWFNPLIYMCCKAVETAGEAYCDEAVLEKSDVNYRIFYGEMIIGLAEIATRKTTLLSTCFYDGKTNMKRRLSMIMNDKGKFKKLSVLALACVICLTVLSGSVIAFATPSTNETHIGLEKAKEIALADAGLNQKDVIFVKAKLDRDGARYEYDIEFYSGNIEYDYEINATTGKILERDRDIEYYAIPGTQTTTPSSSPQTFIGEEKAKAIALENAGLKESDVVFIVARLDYDDGHTVYDVEFYSGNIEYDYEIDAKTGEIWSYDFDVENYSVPSTSERPATQPTKPTTPPSQSANDYIGEEKAKSIALSHAGLSESEVRYISVHLDYDDGRAVYDVSFYKGYYEYDYEIDASTGNIWEWDCDYDD